MKMFYNLGANCFVIVLLCAHALCLFTYIFNFDSICVCGISLSYVLGYGLFISDTFYVIQC